MPRKNRPARNRRVQTSKVARIETMIGRALTSLPVIPIGKGAAK